MEEDKQSSEAVFNCEVVRTLGQGGYGKVFLATATSPSLPPLLAVKSAFFSPSEPGSADSVESLLREAVFYDYLPDSPYIIRSYGHQTIHDGGYLARANLFLEYAPAGSLRDHLRSFPHGLPEPRVRAFTASILRGLRHLHRNHIVHCDLKPGFQ